MKSTFRVRLSSHGLSFAVHAITIALLCIATVVVPLEIIDPPRVEIGEQIRLPAQLSLSGTPSEDSSDAAPPSGQENPEEYSPRHGAEIPKQMLLDPDEPLSADETETTQAGLPGEPLPPAQPVDGIFGPASPGKPGVDSEGIPLLFGMPIRGKTVFLVDVSGSMASGYKYVSRLDAVKAELINCIELMSDQDEFDVVTFSGDKLSEDDYCDWLWGEITFATRENKDIAIEWIQSLEPEGSTPTYEALQHVCEEYPLDLDNLLLLTDGYPDGDVAEMLDEFPLWFSEFEACKFMCISIGNEGEMFMKLLANSVTGMYSVIE